MVYTLADIVRIIHLFSKVQRNAQLFYDQHEIKQVNWKYILEPGAEFRQNGSIKRKERC